MPTTWTPWAPHPSLPAFTPAILRETLDGGQAFRWAYDPAASHWQGAWGNHVARLQLSPAGALLSSIPARRPDTLPALARYLGANVDWAAMADSLPWRSDPHLATCLAAYPGLRLLQQPFAETLLAFLCSATKQIPQIKVMCANLARALGSEIIPGLNALPTWPQVAAATETELRALGLGFRAKNIKQTADRLAADPTLLPRIEAAPYPEAHALLLQLPGVGAKIADCALLFGAAKWQAFPVDTWILKVLEKRYALQGWTPAQLAHFGRTHFGPHAGYAQQFLFSQERAKPSPPK